MFDLDVGKLIVVAAIALVVIGPKELPDVLRALGKAVAKLQRLRTQLQRAVTDFAEEADLKSVENDLRSIESYSSISIAANPATAMRGHLQAALPGADNPSSSSNDPQHVEKTWSSPEMKDYLAPESEPELLSTDGACRKGADMHDADDRAKATVAESA